MAQSPFRRLIYIIGPGRSGSTALERVLASAPGVFAMGEVFSLWRMPTHLLACACGSPIAQCAFWRETLSVAGIGEPQLQILRSLESDVSRHRFFARMRFDLDAVSRDARVQRFTELQTKLFDAIQAVSGAKTLIDSSKAGSRAWLVASSFDVDFIHLYRAPADVIASWRSPKFDPGLNSMMHKPSVFDAARDWWTVEWSAARLARLRPMMRVNYDAFWREPKEALSAALSGRLSGLVESLRWSGDRSVSAAAAYHSVNGNPIRFEQGDITITGPRLTRRDLSWRERPLVEAVGAALEKAFP